MINPVNNNIPNEYSAQTNRAAKVDNSEHFSLESAMGDNEKGVIYEPSSEKETQAKNSESQASKQKDSYVSSLEVAMADKKPLSDPVIDPGTEALYKLWDKLQNFFTSLFKNVKQFFGNVWDSKPINEGMEPVSVNKPAEAVSNASPEKDTNFSPIAYSDIDEIEKERDNNIRQALADGDKDKFRMLVTNGGKNLPVHSTSTITTYDRAGKIVNINPSDENKILHGDRGVTKL